MGAGRFITFEGADGGGKSTQARILAEFLRGRGLDVVLTREPGGAPGAERLRGLLLDNKADWHPLAETFLLFAARAEHVEKIIRPALASGTWVVCDRFTDSTIAYQGAGEGIERTVLDQLIAMIDLRPDWTIILDIDDATRRARLSNRHEQLDHYESKPDIFYQKIRAVMLDLADLEAERCTIFDGSKPIDQITLSIRSAIEARFF